MTKRAQRHLVALIAFAMPWSGAAIVGAGDQAPPKPEPVIVSPFAPKDEAPSKKKSANVFDPLEMQGFSVALLLGEVHGASTPDHLPAGAKKALADLREFLPYKNYRLLDTQWIRCCAGPNVTGMLRGIEDQQYVVEIGINSVSAPKMTANFSLSDGAAKTFISSNFSIETGETVVIGTSSLKGDKALVVLLTAVPRSTTAVTTKKGSGR